MSLSVGFPARASSLARPRVAESDHRSTRTLVLLVALALGALAVVALVVPRVPALAQVVGLAPAAAPVAPPVPVTAVVTATTSCLAAEPYDRISLEVGGVRRDAQLDGCGRSPGFPVTVEVPADGVVTGPLAVVGTRGAAARTATDAAGAAVSPLAARLELALAVAAALGAGSLVVVLARRPAARRSAVGRRGARPARNPVPAQRDRHRR